MKWGVSSLAFITFASVLSGGFANAAQTSSPAPAPSATASVAPGNADAAVMARAKEWLHRFQTGDVDRSQLDARVNGLLTADLVKQVSAQLAPLGDPTSFTFVGKQDIQDGNTAYVYRAVFKSATLNEIFAVDKDGKISGIRFQPAQ